MLEYRNCRDVSQPLSQDHVVRVERTSFYPKEVECADDAPAKPHGQAVHGVEAQFDRAHTETRPLFYGVVEGSIDDRFTRIEAINAGDQIVREFDECGNQKRLSSHTHNRPSIELWKST